MTAAATNRVPHQVLLFSGHMIDAPGRRSPRFPPAKEAAARRAIDDLLTRLDADAHALAVCSGACGGDLLFAEAALALAVPLEVYLPFEPSTFAVESVDFAGADWHARFEAACAAAMLHVMPRDRGALPAGADPYEENNRWMLDAASRFGAERVQFICLWNGEAGDGPGGARHLMAEVTRRRGRSHRIDSNRL